MFTVRNFCFHNWIAVSGIWDKVTTEFDGSCFYPEEGDAEIAVESTIPRRKAPTQSHVLRKYLFQRFGLSDIHRYVGSITSIYV